MRALAAAAVGPFTGGRRAGCVGERGARVRVANGAAQLNLCFARAPPRGSRARVQSDRPRSSVCSAHGGAGRIKGAGAARPGHPERRGARGIGGDDPRVRELERRARQAERAAPASLPTWARRTVWSARTARVGALCRGRDGREGDRRPRAIARLSGERMSAP